MHDSVNGSEPKEDRKFIKFRDIIIDKLCKLENTTCGLELAFNPVLSTKGEEAPEETNAKADYADESELSEFINNLNCRLDYLNRQIKSICDRSGV